MPDMVLGERIEAAGADLVRALAAKNRERVMAAMEQTFHLLGQSENPVAQPGRLEILDTISQSIAFIGVNDPEIARRGYMDKATDYIMAAIAHEWPEEPRNPSGRVFQGITLRS